MALLYFPKRYVIIDKVDKGNPHDVAQQIQIRTCYEMELK